MSGRAATGARRPKSQSVEIRRVQERWRYFGYGSENIYPAGRRLTSLELYPYFWDEVLGIGEQKSRNSCSGERDKEWLGPRHQ